MREKVLFVATVLRGHILAFHLPYMRWFQEQGYEVHCCAANDTGAPIFSVPYCDRYIEIPFARSPFDRGNREAYRRLKANLKEEHYTLVHCHTPVGATLGRLAARKTRKTGSRVCYTAHGFHFYRGAPLIYWLLYYPAERLLARFTDLLITLNAEDYKRAKRFKAREVALVQGVGVDLTPFGAPPDRDALRAEIGVGSDTPVVLSVGEHIERKNHAACIRAIKQIDGAALVFCGAGKQENEMKALAIALGVADRVHFLGFRQDIPALLLAADVFVFPSRQEGLPLALMEAMAAGLPCVVSGVRGNTDLIGDNEGGLAYRPDDVKGIAAGLRTLLQQPELRAQFGERNRTVIRQYSLQNTLAQMAALYNVQLGKRGEA